MHHASAFVSTLGTGGKFLDRPLSATEARHVESLLRIDATNYLYSACVSIGDALQGADRALFTWATVKLYYSAFYLLRALLALSGRALLYDEGKPRTLLSRTGEQPAPFSGKIRGSHQQVIAYFSRSFPGHSLLSQAIVSDAPFDWLLHLRERANYQIGRFPDPVCPAHFLTITRIGMRRALTEYVSDKTYLYAFDPDHAVLALPVEALKQTIAHPNLDIAANTDATAQMFFRGLCKDRAGPMTDFLSLLKI